MKPKIRLCFSLLLSVAVAVLSICLLVEHRRIDEMRELQREFQAQVANAGVEIDDSTQRQHVPLVGTAKGSSKAPITIVEFADFQCPFSARSTATLDQLFKEYLGDLRFYFRHNPLPF